MATSPMQELQRCRDGQDFIRFATRHGGRVESGGRHMHVLNQKGELVAIPCHGNGQEIGKGLRCKIIKIFIKMGLCGIVLYLMAQAGMDLGWVFVIARNGLALLAGGA